jgi:predicted regulator of Ras-like GTPase activity (Roadblock/LC7/MglB family)
VVSGQRLSDVLANLRRSLDAQVTLLLDENGHIIAQTGELPDASFESQWTGLIMSAISSSAKLVRQLADPKGGGAQLISGESMRMVLAPVGGLALVVVLKASKTNLRLALTMDEVLFAQKELSYILGEIPPEAVLSALPPVTPLIAVREPVPTPSKSVETEKVLEEPEAALSTEDFTKLFEQQEQPVNRKAANDFWETAAETEEVESESPDVLNYDEANRLGLTPDQES